MSIFKCTTCGHLEFDRAPGGCPVCRTPADRFEHKDNIFIESREKSPEAEAKHAPELRVSRKCGLIPEEGCTDVFARIGVKLHPMQEAHYITFIDCYLDGSYIARVMLTPGAFPAACFHLKKDSGKVTIVENCNLHGWWMAEIDL